MHNGKYRASGLAVNITRQAVKNYSYTFYTTIKSMAITFNC